MIKANLNTLKLSKKARQMNITT